MHDRPAWKRFITSTAFIAFVVGFSVTVGVRAILRENPTHIEFAKECAVLDGRVQNLNGVTFCATIQTIPDVIYLSTMSKKEKYELTHKCLAAGGQMFDFSRNDFDYGCYTFTIFKELGARNDYVPNN
jgi:hypothetical protein